MKIIGMLSTYNDEDIISEVIENLLSQGIELVILDNGSKDKTFDICKKFLNKGVLDLIQHKTDTFQGNLILRMLYDMAFRYSPEWVIKVDSDEFLESGIKNVTLKEAIEKIDSENYNLIQFDQFNFFMTDADNENANSIKKRLTYYSCVGDFLYRAWKYFPGIRIGGEGGHYPIFPEGYLYRIYPKKFVLRHYTFRNKIHAEKKMEESKKRALKDAEGTPVLNEHLVKVLKQNFSNKIDHKLLTKYNEDGKWNLKRKFCPFTNPNPPKKEDIFLDDGTLRTKQKNVDEYKLTLIRKNQQISQLENQLNNYYKKSGRVDLVGKNIFKKVRKKIKQVINHTFY